MNQLFSRLPAALLLAAAPSLTLAQSVGIGTNAPAASAALEVASTSQGLLLPRLTSAQRAAIANPAVGLQVFQTDGTLGVYQYTGVAWVNLTNGRVPDAEGSTVPANGAVVSTLTSSIVRPSGVAVDGNVYVTDQELNTIRKITPAGVVSTLAGTGAQGSANGAGTAATFNRPFGVGVDAGGIVYVADRYNNQIRRITPAGVVSTLAGSGTAGSADGPGPAATFNEPFGVVADAGGTLYVADRAGNRVRVIR